MRYVQIIWWAAVILVLLLTMCAGLDMMVEGKMPYPVTGALLFLALAGALWAVGRRLMDIITIERLSD